MGRDEFVTIEVESSLEPGVFISRVGRIMGRRTYGFNTTFEGWSLRGGQPGDTPAEFLIFKPKGRRKIQAIPVERVRFQPKEERR